MVKRQETESWTGFKIGQGAQERPCFPGKPVIGPVSCLIILF